MSKGLGKGLGALISEKPKPRAASSGSERVEEDSYKASILDVDIDKVVPGKFQPRQFFGEEEIHELADSIRKNGVFQPILVRESGKDGYEIIAGERRWRASKICGLKSVPVIVKNLDDKEALEVAIVENVQRQDLTALEVAEGYSRLMEEFGYTQEALSDVIGKSRSAIANTVRLLLLPEKVKEYINEDKISAGHARALLGAEEPQIIADVIIKKELNVRQTEALIKRMLKGESLQKAIRDPEVSSLEEEISKKVGHKVRITNKGEGGNVTISYNSLEELDIILSKIMGQ